jgi:cation transport ATPase
MLEAQVDKAAEQDANNTNNSNRNMVSFEGVTVQSQSSSTQLLTAAMSSIDSIRSGESLMNAVDLVEETTQRIEEKYEQVIFLQQEKEKEKEQEKDKKSKNNKKQEKAKDIRETIISEVVASNPLLLGLSPLYYLQRNLKQIKSADLESALLLLPFHYVKRLFPFIIELLKKGMELELNTRIVLFLLSIHSNQIITTKTLLNDLQILQDLLFQNLLAYRNLIGMNMMGFWMMQRQIEEQQEEVTGFQEMITGESKEDKKQKELKQNEEESGKVVHLEGTTTGVTGKKRKLTA